WPPSVSFLASGLGENRRLDRAPDYRHGLPAGEECPAKERRYTCIPTIGVGRTCGAVVGPGHLPVLRRRSGGHCQASSLRGPDGPIGLAVDQEQRDRLDEP